VYDVASNWEQAVVSCPEGAWQPSVSNDGDWLLFLSFANFAGRNASKHIQAFLMRTDGSELRQLTRPDDEIESAVLAGNGTVAYASTARNQLLRINVIDGRVEEVMETTPGFIEDSIYGAPGSTLEIDGRELTGARVLLNGAPLQVLWSLPQRTAVQIPLDTPQGRMTLSLDSPVKSTLECGTMTMSVGP
jgi:hypothetical protein